MPGVFIGLLLSMSTGRAQGLHVDPNTTVFYTEFDYRY